MSTGGRTTSDRTCHREDGQRRIGRVKREDGQRRIGHVKRRTDSVKRTCQLEDGQHQTDVSIGGRTASNGRVNGRTDDAGGALPETKESKKTERMKETAASLIFRIGYKRLHERERERGQYTAESPHYIHAHNSHVYSYRLLSCNRV